MSKRTLSEALAHAEGVRHFNLPQDDHQVIIGRQILAEVYSDFVLLADEVKRLQGLNAKGDAALLACSCELRLVGNEVLRLQSESDKHARACATAVEELVKAENRTQKRP